MGEQRTTTGRRRRSPRRGDTPFDRFVADQRAAGALQRLTGLRGASKRVAGAHLIRSHGDRSVLYVTPHSRAADAAVLALQGLLGERPDDSRIRVFPRHDVLPFDRFSPQPFLVAQRMEVLHRLDERGAADRGESEASGAPDASPPPIVVAPLSALCLRVPARAALRAKTQRVRVGDEIDRDELVARLVGVGYQRMALVEEPGEVAVRGDIVDVFPPQLATPVRIEFWGDEVDKIRSFDPASQRSQEKSASALIPPPRELLFDREAIVARQDGLRAAAEAQGVDEREVDEW